MKALSPIALFCISCMLFTCSEPEHTGNQIDHVKYYINWSPDQRVFSGRRDFTYDAQGRVKKSIWKPASGPAKVNHFTYGEHETIVKGDSLEVFLKFERGYLAQHISKETFKSGVQRMDTIRFSYLSGKLVSVSYDNEIFEVQTDIRANIAYILEDGIFNLHQYDKVPNPFQNLPTRFLSTTRGETQKKDVLWLNIIRYFSSNNTLDQMIREYSYREGKVSEIVSYSNDFGLLVAPSTVTTERIRYNPL